MNINYLNTSNHCHRFNSCILSIMWLL